MADDLDIIIPVVEEKVEGLGSQTETQLQQHVSSSVGSQDKSLYDQPTSTINACSVAVRTDGGIGTNTVESGGTSLLNVTVTPSQIPSVSVDEIQAESSDADSHVNVLHGVTSGITDKSDFGQPHDVIQNEQQTTAASNNTPMEVSHQNHNNEHEDPQNDTTVTTTDILRQALVEASGGDISHIENDDADLYTPAINSTQDVDAAGDSEVVPKVDVTGGQVDSHGEAVGTTQPIVPANKSFQQSAPNPPLGSKTNPIRIIQQGNTYTSTQKLSSEQIQQIVKVLQRQNIASKCVDGESTAVYNPETNTRIVYRVVQPHAKANLEASSNSKPGTLTARDYHQAKYGPIRTKSKGRPRKRARRDSDDPETSPDELDEPTLGGDSDSDGGDMAHIDQRELSPTERLRKKKEKPITRAGRISKPPSHMVKDYKQIHRVDWYEDYDDSDGGYSDIYDSGNEDNNTQEGTKRKSKLKFPCSKCEKSYIGAKNLARHYKLTGHGDGEALLKEEEEKAKAAAAENTPEAPSTSSISVSELGATPTPDDAVKATDSISAEGTPTPTAAAGSTEANKTPAAAGFTPVGRGRGRGRGKRKTTDEDLPWRPPSYSRSREPKMARSSGTVYKPSPATSSASYSTANRQNKPTWSVEERKVRRIQKLASIMGSFSCAEILEAAVPRLRKDRISLYDVLESGLAAPPGERPSYTRMLQLYTELQGKMTELAQLCLRPITKEEQVAEDKEAIQITTESIAHSIGIEAGLFEVSDLPEPVTSQAENQTEAGDDNTSSSQTKEDPQPTEEPAVPPVQAPPTAVTPEPDLSSVDTEKAETSLPPTTSESINASSLDAPPQDAALASDVVEPPAVAMPASDNSEVPMMGAAPSIAELVSRILPGDIIQLDGQKIVIPEGASIVHTDDGIMIYESAEPGAPSVLNLKLA